MKVLMTGLIVFFCAIIAWGEVFQMDRKGETTVEVKKSVDEYRVTCKFRPQTKFDKAVNAKMNDAKGDSLCKKGLARYLNVAANETLTISGQYSVAPVETVDERLCYFFGVPVSGCRISKAGNGPTSSAVLEKPTAITLRQSHGMINGAIVRERGEIKPKVTAQPKRDKCVHSSSYVCVAKYKEVNGKQAIISHQEYQGHDFKSPKEFDRFCQQEFTRIRALGEANLRAVRTSEEKRHHL